MNYKNAFAIDEIAFNKKKDKNENPYQLNNFDYYEAKLIDNFYLKYFTYELLFKIDILDLEDFIDFHYSNCGSPKDFIKIIDFKIIPKITEIVSNAKFSSIGDNSSDRIELDGGLVKSGDFIFHPFYTDSFFYHTTAIHKSQEVLKKKKSILNDFIARLCNNHNQENLKWIGKPSHLGFLINQLIEYGYIAPPVKHNMDINISELSRTILSSFSLSKGKQNTVVEYSKKESLNFIKLNERFVKKGFHLPHSSQFD